MRRSFLAVAKTLADLPGDLERHPRAAEVGKRVATARPSRMDDDVGLGPLRSRRVVVGHEELEPELASESRLVQGRDAAIDGHDQRCLTLQRQRAERLGIDAVTLIDAVRDVILDVVGPCQLQAGPENAGSANAIDVVITVDDDLSTLANGPDNAIGRLGGAGKCFGVVKTVTPRLQKGPSTGGVGDAPVQQELGNERGQSRGTAQAVDPVPVVRAKVPVMGHPRPPGKERDGWAIVDWALQEFTRESNRPHSLNTNGGVDPKTRGPLPSRASPGSQPRKRACGSIETASGRYCHRKSSCQKSRPRNSREETGP